MNVAQNVCLFAKGVFQLLQDPLYQLNLIHFHKNVQLPGKKKKNNILKSYVGDSN